MISWALTLESKRRSPRASHSGCPYNLLPLPRPCQYVRSGAHCLGRNTPHPQYRHHPRRRHGLLRRRLLRRRDPHAQPRSRWPRTGCGSRSSTTRPAAGRRGRASSPATMPSRSAATICPASTRRCERQSGPPGRGCCPSCSARWATARITRANGTSTARCSRAGSTTRTPSTITTAISTPGSIAWTTAPCRPSSRAAVTTPPPPSPITPSRCWPNTRRNIARRRSFCIWPSPVPHFPAAGPAAGHRACTATATGPAGMPCGRSAIGGMRAMGMVNCPLSPLEPNYLSRRGTCPRSDFAAEIGPGEVDAGRAVEQPHRRAEAVSADQDGHSRSHDPPHGHRDRPRARAAPGDGRVRQHA